ncbi:MAG: NFACT RNA binding domain-containing protein [Candidatus Muirbacterium halophilum]|nr:NFACT RNA binding domain-containing protein [Candidatus Muirbacterium halophilum]MCK9475806.1 NFACT RNA binding domain-containing protein [Candidatus Muirbacterium halophilum]
MIIDAWNYFFICEELKCDFLNSKLVKIKMLDDYTFVFEFLTRYGVKKILVDHTYGVQCIFTLDKTTELQKKDTSSQHHDFMMILRKNIINSKLFDIYIYNWDRVIVFEFNDKKLIFEMFGKSSNIILISDNDFIIGSLKRFIPSCISHKKINDDLLFNNSRYIVNGKKYFYPQNSRISPDLFIDYNKIDIYKGFGKISRHLLKIFIKNNSNDELFEYRKVNLVDNKKILLKKNNIAVTVFPLLINEFEDYEIIVFDDYYSLFNSIYFNIKNSLDIDKIILSKLNYLSKEKKKLLKRLNSLENIDVMNERYNQFVLYADLLKSVLYKYKGNIDETFIEVDNYYSENMEKIKIPVKKNKNISYSMENYFNQARKEKKRIAKNIERREELLNDIEVLDNYILNLDYFEIPVKSKGNFVKKIYGNVKKIIYKDVIYYIGKNADDNDYILSHIANGNDLWFHAQNYKGAHVICKIKKNQAQPEFILKGAELAANNCEAKRGGNIPVDYTEVKFVKKIKGVKGKVTFSNNKTVFIKI